MTAESLYTKKVSEEHLKSFGQFFTPECIADFMAKWVCEGAANLLDPAVGNSVFFKYAKMHNAHCQLNGFEKDKTIIEHFGNPYHATLWETDYFDSPWNIKFDAIICNPPYSKFQAIKNRNEIIQNIFEHTGVQCSGYTNLYLFFLLKSIFQLSQSGRLAYIIPSEFLNSQYGETIKKLLIDQKLIRAIINIQNNNIFENAITTSCILLLDKSPKAYVEFINIKQAEDIRNVNLNDCYGDSTKVSYEELHCKQKWRDYLKQEVSFNINDAHTVEFSVFGRASRGVATGSNDFFCFSKEQAEKLNIPSEFLKKCICRSADIINPVFTEKNFADLEKQGKTVFLLDVRENDEERIRSYIEHGVRQKIPEKYLPSCRKPWFSMEQKKEAPIWISSAFRENIKIVRNLAGISNLTTFHAVYVHEGFKDYTDIIFCYLLTPIAQKILRKNRKELGNGLDKFQPNDINHARVLDLTLLNRSDKQQILHIFESMKTNFSNSQVMELNHIFTSYL